MSALAVVIPFPMHRVRRPRKPVTDVFAPLRDVAKLEQAQSRLVWVCTLATTALSLALQLSIG